MIRHTTPEDLPKILEIYAYAREFMRRNGNPNQWGDDRPLLSAIERDIENRNSYLVTDETGEICGIFAFLIGNDPTYEIIEEGQWLNDAPYGVIHRIAGNGKRGGILEETLAFCKQYVGDLRIDTHEDNRVMQHLLEKNGFTKCGIIYTDNGTPRLAYQKEFA